MPSSDNGTTYSPILTLYLRPTWSSLFPHILLHHQTLANPTYPPFTFTTVPISDQTVTTSPSYAQKNPKKQIPVLFIDDEPITENPAIAHAIHSLQPVTGLFGNGTDDFVKCCEWLNWISASFHAQAWSPYLRPWRFTTDPFGEAGVKAKALEKLLERFGMVESWLPPADHEGGWAVGETFTVVDAYLLPFWLWAEGSNGEWGFEVGERLPRYKALMGRVRGLQAVRKALESEEEIVREMGGWGIFEPNR